MNLDNIRKGVAALRSGEYKQARSALRTDSGYCCLGVMCDVYRKETGKGVWDKLGLNNPNAPYDFLSCSGVLPTEVALWYGLSSNPSFDHPTIGPNCTLAHLNDQHKLSFNEIADVIESNFLQEHSGSTTSTNSLTESR